jgi:deoxyribonuclease IV
VSRAPARGLLLGAHVPVTGGLRNAPGNGTAIGATAIQVFTSNQRQWKARDLGDEECAAFQAALPPSGVRHVMSHASYLINLASPDPLFEEKSRATLAEELLRCDRLGIPHAVVHPGAHMGRGEDEGLAAIARSIDDVFERAPGRARLLLEVTAGQGTCLGHRFEHVAEMLSRVKTPERVGVCLDTCHLLAAGYDIATPRGWDRTLREMDATFGLARVDGVHLNDSKLPLGCRVDRHAKIGQGVLGVPAFRRILNDERLAGRPFVIETPGPVEDWRAQVDLLRGLVRRPRT